MGCRRLFALALGLACAFSPAFAQDDWTLYAPTGGSFSILVPTRPEALPPTTETNNGIPYETHMFRVESAGLTYVFGWTEYHQPMDVEGEIDANRDNLVAGLSGRLTGETRISQNRVVGRDFTGEAEVGFFISRVFVSGSRTWQAVVVVPSGNEGIRAAMKFLYSLQVTAGQ